MNNSLLKLIFSCLGWYVLVGQSVQADEQFVWEGYEYGTPYGGIINISHTFMDLDRTAAYPLFLTVEVYTQMNMYSSQYVFVSNIQANDEQLTTYCDPVCSADDLLPTCQTGERPCHENPEEICNYELYRCITNYNVTDLVYHNTSEMINNDNSSSSANLTILTEVTKNARNINDPGILEVRYTLGTDPLPMLEQPLEEPVDDLSGVWAGLIFAVCCTVLPLLAHVTPKENDIKIKACGCNIIIPSMEYFKFIKWSSVLVNIAVGFGFFIFLADNPSFSKSPNNSACQLFFTTNVNRLDDLSSGWLKKDPMVADSVASFIDTTVDNSTVTDAFTIYRADECNFYVVCQHEVNGCSYASDIGVSEDNVLRFYQDDWLPDAVCDSTHEVEFSTHGKKFGERGSDSNIYATVIFLFFFSSSLLSAVVAFFEIKYEMKIRENPEYKSKKRQAFFALAFLINFMFSLPINALVPVDAKEIGCDTVLTGAIMADFTSEILIAVSVLGGLLLLLGAAYNDDEDDVKTISMAVFFIFILSIVTTVFVFKEHSFSHLWSTFFFSFSMPVLNLRLGVDTKLSMFCALYHMNLVVRGGIVVVHTLKGMLTGDSERGGGGANKTPQHETDNNSAL